MVMGGSTTRGGKVHAGTAVACTAAETVHVGTSRDDSGGGSSISDRASSIDKQRRWPRPAPRVTAPRTGGGDGGAVEHRDGRPRRRRPDGRQQTTVGGWPRRSPTPGGER